MAVWMGGCIRCARQAMVEHKRPPEIGDPSCAAVAIIGGEGVCFDHMIEALLEEIVSGV